jgi:hypothetical protein
VASTWSDGEHDLSFRPRPQAFQHQVSVARVRERQDCTHMCSQLPAIEETSDLREIPSCDIHQKELGRDAMALRKLLVGR